MVHADKALASAKAGHPLPRWNVLQIIPVMEFVRVCGGEVEGDGENAVRHGRGSCETVLAGGENGRSSAAWPANGLAAATVLQKNTSGGWPSRICPTASK